MGKRETELALAIFELILRLGAPAAIKIIRELEDSKAWNPDQIRTLLVDPDVRKYYEGT